MRLPFSRYLISICAIFYSSDFSIYCQEPDYSYPQGRIMLHSNRTVTGRDLVINGNIVNLKVWGKENTYRIEDIYMIEYKPGNEWQYGKLGAMTCASFSLIAALWPKDDPLTLSDVGPFIKTTILWSGVGFFTGFYYASKYNDWEILYSGIRKEFYH